MILFALLFSLFDYLSLSSSKLEVALLKGDFCLNKVDNSSINRFLVFLMIVGYTVEDL